MHTGYQPAYRVERRGSILGRKVPQHLGIPVLRLPSLACAEPDLVLAFAQTAASYGQGIQKYQPVRRQKPQAYKGTEINLAVS